MNKNAFDFIRNSLNRIADGIASSDGRYPVWDYKSLLELINTLEEEYKKNDGASARSSLQQTCNNLATDCVYRQEAIDAIDEIESEIAEGFGFEYEKWRKYFCDLPPVQPDLSEYSDKLWQKAYERGKAEAQAEIVRCKDCRFNTYSKKCLNPDSFFLVPADDFYCGYAERRTDE